MSRAAEPETMGAAPEVPPKGSWPTPLPATAEIEAPGAPISGFTWMLPIDGPREEEPVMWRTSGMPTAGSRRTVTPAARPLLRRLESAWLIM